ncbi:MAG: hypothetical protein HOL80_00500 [Candidatus Magasanikbacteria bacterium]|jgi:hypothetical protein|nr:hypothetical protein [Candidatus Magasanikbacteria bacterium]MBT5262361.1 hypothetical protein [Candidatus Magasanikbacteria bacterium]
MNHEEPPFHQKLIEEGGVDTTFYSKFEGSLNNLDVGFIKIETKPSKTKRRREILSFSNIFLVICWVWTLLDPPIWVLGLFLLTSTTLTLLFGKFNNPRKTNEKRATYLVAQLNTPWVDMTLKLREIRRVVRGFFLGRSISKYSLILQMPIYLGIGWALFNGNEAALATPTAVISALILKVYGDWLAVRFYLRDWHRWSWIPGIKKI